jgi:RimJ/RimL family protein N-acetyltransferase
MRSKRVLEKCGFSYEATLKMAETVYDLHVYDTDCYARTA